MVYQMVSFSMTLNDLNPHFNGTLLVESTLSILETV